ncbi:hypothetical protein OROMI_010987 [Orobanche minor]
MGDGYGLLNAVGHVAPFAEHRNCAHVYCNWKKQFKGATLKNLFWRAIRCTYQEEWNAAVDDLKAENAKAYDSFIERDPSKFCKAFVSTRCVSDMVDNNVSETFNGYIVRARAKHIIHMLEDIRCALRQRQYVKLEMIRKWNDIIYPNIRKKIEKLKQASRFCDASLGINGDFEVKHLISKDSFVVSLANRKCTCRMWDVTGIPCIHGLSAINFMRHDPADFVHSCFTVNVYKKAYSFGLPAINGERMWPKGVGYPVEPSLVRKMPGRPKKKRKRDQDEKDPKNPNRLRKVGVEMTCRNCWDVGHNRRSCQKEKIQKPHKEPGKRGRPRKHPVIESSRRGTTIQPELPQSEAQALKRAQALKKAIAKERAHARKGIGRLGFEATGNAYVHMSCDSTIYYQPGPGGGSSSSSIRRSTHAGSSEIPTQESRAN